jgi:hypothetical protein
MHVWLHATTQVIIGNKSKEIWPVKTPFESRLYNVQCGYIYKLVLLSSLLLLPAILAWGQRSATTKVQSDGSRPEVAQSYDITAYGVRAVDHAPLTTASCNGTTSVTVESAAGFQKGDGVVIYGCGATETMATPSAPTVTPGITNTLTVPDAVLTMLAGHSIYLYKLVNRDKFGGLTLPSPATTLTTGPATLGENQLSIRTLSLSGSRLTVVTSTPESLAQGELVHITGASNEVFHAWANVSRITSKTSFVVESYPLYSAAGISATGGTLTYYTGNQITWKNTGSNIWETIVCASRPADSGTYHVIGLSYPLNGGIAFSSNTTFTDWGATLTSKPNLPSYISDSICTAGSATNDYLSTTITNISATTITIANAASQRTAGQTFLYDAAPGIKAAFTYALNNGNYGTVLIPPVTTSGTFFVNSLLDLSSFGSIPLREEGPLHLNETMIGPLRWTGVTAGHCCGASSYGLQLPIVGIGAAWPGVYYLNQIPLMDNLGFSASGNQALDMFIDTGTNQGGVLDKIIFGTGGTGDYTGMGLVARGCPFNQTYRDFVFTNGPGNSSSFDDTTWTPVMYFARNSTGLGCNGVGIWKLENVQFYARTFYAINQQGAGIVHNTYTQGSLLPIVTIQTVTGFSGVSLTMDGINVNDTSGEPYVATLGGTGATVYLAGASGLSSGGRAGVPPQITGTLPRAIFGLTDNGSQMGPGFGANQSNSHPFDVVPNSSFFDSQAFYANDYLDAGNFNSSRGIFQNAGPVSSNSGMFVPLATPILSVPAASSGGSIPEGGHLWCVNAVGFSAGWSKSSCQYFTVVGKNQTLTFNWTPVTGAQGYVLSRDGVQCLPDTNASCGGLTALVGTTNFVYNGAGASPGGIAPKTAAGDGSNGFNASGHFGLKYSCPETPPPPGVPGFDILYCDSGAHAVKELANSGSAYLLTRTIASGTSALGTSSIPSGACAPVVTGTATGAATADNLIIDDNASDLSGVTGYGVGISGALTIYKRITPGRVNFTICNSTRATITPGALTLQWRVVR